LIKRVREPWDFVFFMRTEQKVMPILEEVAKECRKLKKPIYAYFLVGTPKNAEILKAIGWPTTAKMEEVEKVAPNFEGIVDGIIATCAGDAQGDLELLKKLQKFRS
jgi:hypothetical protein